MTLKISVRRGLLLGALCLPLVYAACSRRAGTPGTPFPASNQVSGWVKTGDTRNFPAAELWNYIDGDAERYVKAGVLTTSTADYNFQNTFDAVADVYTMGEAKGARTILEAEPMNQAKSVQIGDSGVLYGGSLVFSKGPYLVRIVAYKQSPEVQAALQELGREIARRLVP